MDHDSQNMVLVGDIGGTNIRLGIADISRGSGHIGLSHFTKFEGDSVPDVYAAIAGFLSQIEDRPRYAALGLAGPIIDGSVTLTHRKTWTVSEAALRAQFGFDGVQLYNDFTVMARSIPALSDTDFHTIIAGDAVKSAPVLVAGAGTGFGVATLLPINDRWHVLSGEGGHQAFSPQTEAECELLRILQTRHDFVSLELVSSGKSMNAVHQAICDRHGLPYVEAHPAEMLTRAKAGDPVALELCHLRGAAIMGGVGDLALINGAQGGVVLAGGVSERLIDYVKTPDARRRFTNRGPRSAYMAKVPVKLLHNPAAPLFGAAALHCDSKATEGRPSDIRF